MSTRRQLTLFVPPDAAAPLEAVRRAADPVQHALIGAHVTLCREHEQDAFEAMLARLRDVPFGPVRLVFGVPTPFGGHGWLLPCTDGHADFHALRAHLWPALAAFLPAPHLTLAHPRNPQAPGNTPALATALPPGLAVGFGEVTLIEQTDGGPWRTLQTVALRR